MGRLLRDRPVVRGLVRGLAIVVIVVGVAYLGLWGVWQVWGPGWLADEAAGAVAAQPVTPIAQEQYQAGYAAGCEVGKSDAAYGNDAGRSAWMVDGTAASVGRRPRRTTMAGRRATATAATTSGRATPRGASP
jgi:hypothetical protein